MEIRYLGIEYRLKPDSRSVSGYACVFNVESKDLGGFTEIIDSAAFDGVLETSDVLCFLNHNEDRGLLARSSNLQGSLMLTVNKIGLQYSFDAPNTSLGDELLEGLRRGDIRSSSFGFKVDKETWTRKPDGGYLRTILKFKEICDVSPVYKPAYDKTDIALRSLSEFKEQDNKYIDELISYYADYKKQFEFLN